MYGKGLLFRGETKHLDETARLQAPGKFILVKDGMVHYDLIGPEDGQIVVLVPGLSVSDAVWDRTWDALIEDGFRVLRYDLYGRGYSDRPDVDSDRDLFDRQLYELLSALGIEELINLVGLSLGGVISVIFTKRHPELVKKLCLIDPGGLPWKQSLPAQLVQIPLIGEWIRGLVGEKVLVKNFKDYFSDPSKSTTLMPCFLNQMKFKGYKRAILSSQRSGITTGASNAFETVGNLEIPVMLIWGREDQTVLFETHNKGQELIPQLEFHPVDHAAHIPHYEQSELVNSLLIEFLS